MIKKEGCISPNNKLEKISDKTLHCPSECFLSHCGGEGGNMEGMSMLCWLTTGHVVLINIDSVSS